MATRKQIRDFIAGLIAPDFVKTFPYQEIGLNVADLPCAFVTVEAGDSEEDFDKAVSTEAVLTIQLTVHGGGNLEDALDALAAKINTRFDDDETLNGLIDGMHRSGFAYDPDKTSMLNTLAITYAITYDDED